ncbi:hypothetical protein [Haloarchaeobius salinus]|uniref:hypothetical protein n=1 Tax=Haloarchaeobius salinus TaxID=1198298 RepID=UPI00210E42DB|nr:hypothetical protein [Haloarchaeobius salinus]
MTDDTTHDTDDEPRTTAPDADDAGSTLDDGGSVPDDADGPAPDADGQSTDDSEPAVTEAEPGRDGGDGEPPESDDGSGDRVRRSVLWVALAVLALFSVVLLFQFYGSTMQAITDWVGPEYRSVVRSTVSLVLLCLTLIGIVQVTRELTR